MGDEGARFPIEPPVEPTLARLATERPPGEGWLFEPKWDGFRAIVFRSGERLYVQSRDLKPLGRYFPELEARLRKRLPGGSVVDGEIVIVGERHPAESRVRKLRPRPPPGSSAPPPAS